MARLQALGRRTKEKYARAIERAFGDREPSYVPNLSKGGRDGGAWPEASRSVLRAAILRYWTSKGEPERGEKIADQIEKGVVNEVNRKVPEESVVFRLETQLLKYDDVRAALVLQLMLGLGLRVEETLMLTPNDLRAALQSGLLTLVVTKGGRHRQLPIQKVRDVISALLQQPARQPHVLDERTAEDEKWTVLGELLARRGSDVETQRNLLSRHLQRLGAQVTRLPWCLHTLRHVFARRMQARGASVNLIKRALGHAGYDGTSLTYLEDKGSASFQPKDLLPYMHTLKPSRV